MNPLSRALTAAIIATATASAMAAGQQDNHFETYVVTLKSGTDARAFAARAAKQAGGEVGFVYQHALDGFSITMPSSAAKGLANHPLVTLVEKDARATIVAQDIPTGISRAFVDLTAFAIDGVDDRRVDADVAVLDTGIDWEHPDLNVVGGIDCTQIKGRGWRQTVYCEPAMNGDDDQYHGTHVAGTIAALDNDIGVVGVAPGARLWAVKVLDASGSGYTSGIIAGIDWVVGRGDIEVINMSLGGSGISSSYKTAIDGAVSNGVTVVVAAGNDNDNSNLYSPAYVPSAITVSALADFDGQAGGLGSATCRADQDDTLADFSNWGSAVDLAAPGVCITSTYPLERGGYDTISGTSMAAPHVAGAAAVLASNGLGPQAIAAVLTGSQNFNWTDDSGDGLHEPLLDMAASGYTPVFVGAQPPEPPTNQAPTADVTVNCSNLDCTFDGTGSSDSDGAVVNYAWRFGDGSEATGPVVQHSYPVTGTYSAELVVTDDAGASDMATVEVSVSDGGSGGSQDNDNDGYTSDVDCNDNDPTINPGARDRGGKKWADGEDNDCNGIIDG